MHRYKFSSSLVQVCFYNNENFNLKKKHEIYIQNRKSENIENIDKNE